MLLTLIASGLTQQWVQYSTAQRLALRVEDISSTIDRHLRDQAALLAGGVGLMQSVDTVTAEQWRTYTEALQSDDSMPGALTIGYIRALVVEDGWASHADQTAIDYFAPVLFRHPATGHDLAEINEDVWAEETQRAAMIRARDTGQPSVTGIKMLAANAEGTPTGTAITIYLPHFDERAVANSIGDRRDNLRGFVYATIRLDGLMSGLFGSEVRNLRLRIFDGHTTDIANLLYSSDGSVEPTAQWRARGAYTTRMRTIAGRGWTLEFVTTPGFTSLAEANLPIVVALGSVVVNLLLFLTIRTLTRQRELARETALEMTSELREAKESAEAAAAREHELWKGVKRSNEKLREANEGLSRFSAIVTHDLRAPLKRTEAFCDILSEEFSDGLDDEAIDILRRVRRNHRRMLKMLDAMQEYTKVGNDRLSTRSAGLNSILAVSFDTLGDLRDAAEIETDLGDCRWVVGDAVLLQHVFFNLIGNSIKFANGERPRIKISAERRDNGMVEIGVSDNGIGIPEEQAERVFELFVRLHNDEEQYTGTGVGLAVCKRIITDHGGDIWVDTKYRPGTRIAFTLRERTDQPGTTNGFERKAA